MLVKNTEEENFVFVFECIRFVILVTTNNFHNDHYHDRHNGCDTTY